MTTTIWFQKSYDSGALYNQIRNTGHFVFSFLCATGHYLFITQRRNGT
jgi:hypothetical protein